MEKETLTVKIGEDYEKVKEFKKGYKTTTTTSSRSGTIRIERVKKIE